MKPQSHDIPWALWTHPAISYPKRQLQSRAGEAQEGPCREESASDVPRLFGLEVLLKSSPSGNWFLHYHFLNVKIIWDYALLIFHEFKGIVLDQSHYGSKSLFMFKASMLRLSLEGASPSSSEAASAAPAAPRVEPGKKQSDLRPAGLSRGLAHVQNLVTLL